MHDPKSDASDRKVTATCRFATPRDLVWQMEKFGAIEGSKQTLDNSGRILRTM